MFEIVEIRTYLTNTFEDECLADKILIFLGILDCDLAGQN